MGYSGLAGACFAGAADAASSICNNTNVVDPATGAVTFCGGAVMASDTVAELTWVRTSATGVTSQLTTSQTLQACPSAAPIELGSSFDPVVAGGVFTFALMTVVFFWLIGLKGSVILRPFWRGL